MPMYDFVCEACGHRFEELAKSSETELPCPECGAKSGRQVSAFAVGKSRPEPSPACGACAEQGSCSMLNS